MEATGKTANGNGTMRARSVGATKAEAGFTLVEAMCAIVILAFGLIAIANLMVVAASSNTVANQSTAATTMASQRLEILKSIPFTDPPGSQIFNPALAPGGDLDGDDATLPAFTALTDVPGVGQIRVQWRITGVPDPLDAVVRTLFIEVRAEGTGALTGARSRAEFTTFRSCTDSEPTGLGCP
jgi:type II secretory pathway pseudopilin PulG